MQPGTLFLASTFALLSPGPTSQVRSITGPLDVRAPIGAPSRRTIVLVDKSEHQLEVRVADTVVASYTVAIGSGGPGPKGFEGDKITPVGTYTIRGRFMGSFHRFLGVSYPNAEDRRRFAERKERGEIPAGRGIGFGIGIHGVGSRELAGVHKRTDWTHGCIAVDDTEIDALSAIVPDGTPLVIVD